MRKRKKDLGYSMYGLDVVRTIHSSEASSSYAFFRKNFLIQNCFQLRKYKILNNVLNRTFLNRKKTIQRSGFLVEAQYALWLQLEKSVLSNIINVNIPFILVLYWKNLFPTLNIQNNFFKIQINQIHNKQELRGLSNLSRRITDGRTN